MHIMIFYNPIMLLFFCCCWLVFPRPALSQNLSEWFSQKKTQKKYLIDQLAANHSYLECLKKGYSIATGGMQSLRAIKQGSFALHQLYFTKLNGVSPSLNQYGKIADVIAFQWRIMRELQGFKKQKFSHFSTDQQNYFLGVARRLLQNCTVLLGQLYACLGTDLQMSTSARISRIDVIYDQMLDCLQFAKEFFNQVRLLHMDWRKQQQHGQHISRLLTIKLQN